MRGDIHIADIFHGLNRCDLLPAIVFRTSRRQCDVDAEKASRNRSLLLPAEEQREMKLRIHKIIDRYEMDESLITTHPHYSGLINTAVGAHHAGQLLMWRLLLEELMSVGVLRILVATGTVAAGVDFPARTVVVTAHSRRGADGYRVLSSAEFQQMSGRAGRRGKDAVGFCLAAPAPFCDARQLLKISKRPPEPLCSAYFPSPSTVLNLLRYRNVDDLRLTVEKSLAAFIDRKEATKLKLEASETEERAKDLERNPPDAGDEKAVRIHGRDLKKLNKKSRRLVRQAEELVARQRELTDAALDGLASLGYVENLSLSEKGYWAANLCTSLVLELAEIIETGMLDGASAETLAAIVGSIAGDSHRTYLQTKTPVLSESEILALNEVVSRVRDTNVPGLNSQVEVVPAAAYTVMMWMQADSWHEFRSILLLAGVAEGDAARLITQTADHLNQLTRLMDTHRELAFRAEEAKRRLLKPPLTEDLSLQVAT